MHKNVSRLPKKQNQQTLVVLAATAVLTALAIISTNTNAASSRD